MDENERKVSENDCGNYKTDSDKDNSAEQERECVAEELLLDPETGNFVSKSSLSQLNERKT
jgi:hypothetical protein